MELQEWHLLLGRSLIHYRMPSSRRGPHPLLSANQIARHLNRQRHSRSFASCFQISKILRELWAYMFKALSKAIARFCKSHLPLTKADEETWLLHRDITHAIVLPVLHIHRQASKIAQSFLCSKSISDLELAFTGEARGAFSWLQCLVGEEEDVCLTRGCPGNPPACCAVPSKLTTTSLRGHLCP